MIDDSAMLLSFVKEILDEQNYRVLTAPTAAEGLEISRSEKPDLILLDFILPDMKGDAVCRQLVADPLTAKIPVVYVSGFGSDLQPDSAEIPNVIGALNKPFTSETLINSVRDYLAGKGSAPNESRPAAPVRPRPTPPPRPAASAPAPVAVSSFAKESKPVPPPPVAPAPAPDLPPAPEDEIDRASRGAYFCGDSSFFSLHWALQTIAREKLTGRLRAFWSRDSVELLAREGEIVLVTTRNPQLYCEEAPVTLLNVDRERIEAARARQASDGCPIFITLAGEGLILREPAMQLVQHYGQRLFSQLWTERVRFMFEQQELPEFTREIARVRGQPRSMGAEHAAVCPIPGAEHEGAFRQRIDPGLHPRRLRTRAGTPPDGGGSAVRLAVQRQPLDRADFEKSAARYQVCPAHALPLSRARDRGMLAGAGCAKAGVARRIARALRSLGGTTGRGAAHERSRTSTGFPIRS